MIKEFGSNCYIVKISRVWFPLTNFFFPDQSHFYMVIFIIIIVYLEDAKKIILPALTGDTSYFRKSNLLHTTMRKDVNNIFIEREFQIIFWSSFYVSSISTKK